MVQVCVHCILWYLPYCIYAQYYTAHLIAFLNNLENNIHQQDEGEPRWPLQSNYVVIWDNISFHRAALVHAWFTDFWLHIHHSTPLRIFSLHGGGGSMIATFICGKILCRPWRRPVEMHLNPCKGGSGIPGSHPALQELTSRVMVIKCCGLTLPRDEEEIVNGKFSMHCRYIAPWSSAACTNASHSPIRTHIHTPTAIGFLNVLLLDTPRVGSNQQPFETSWLSPFKLYFLNVTQLLKFQPALCFLQLCRVYRTVLFTQHHFTVLQIKNIYICTLTHL